MSYAFLSLLAAAAIGEFVLTGRLSLGGAALVYVVLRLQAERAANQFVKYGKDGPPPPPWATPEEEQDGGPGAWVGSEEERAFAGAAHADDPEIKVAPLGGKRKQKSYYGPRPVEETEPKTAKVLAFPAPPKPRAASRPAAAETSAAPKASADFAEPRFRGAPHEVLGVAADAGTKQILRAFRHWIMKHHPDHATPAEAALAGERSRQLNEAKNKLLKARKARSSKSASA